MNSYNDFTDISHDWADKSISKDTKACEGINVLSCFDGLSG